jgi:hypothetical protein
MSDPYHAIPLKSDSAKGATYISGVFTGGGANSDWRDAVYAFQGSIHRSNNFGNFQAYYGANLSLGCYHVKEYSRYDYYYPNDSLYNNVPASYNYFGMYGFNGGINTVIPFSNGGGEWRAIGIEASLQKEFGNYYNFRKNLPDSSADIIFRKNVTGTVGICTDIVTKSRRGIEFGYKAAFGFMLNPQSDYVHVYNANELSPVTYFSQTLHLTRDNITGFIQLNFSNNYAGNMQFGINYMLGRNKK